ncbi:MAG: ATP-dependent dethiobiotin synthetase BioD, partial [Thermodesulfobacteriota bacterium]
EIDFEVIGASFKEFCHGSDVVLLEGAGGLLVPLGGGERGVDGGEPGAKGGREGVGAGRGQTMAHLAVFLGLPLIIVAPSRIGVINHSMLTVRLALQMGLSISGIILNHPALPNPHDSSLASNRAEVARHTGVPLLGEVPYKETNAPYVDVRGVVAALTGEGS